MGGLEAWTEGEFSTPKIYKRFFASNCQLIDIFREGLFFLFLEINLTGLFKTQSENRSAISYACAKGDRAKIVRQVGAKHKYSAAFRECDNLGTACASRSALLHD
ncbi:hypothetical protein [Scytonema tolypothrichoides]|uniref:Uncharacterized protein n=3 Tax=Nostocales TaxID=1161 RepID=A0A0C1NCS7_9CYAN